MALAPFFDRVFNAVGAHLSVSREALESILGSVTVGISLNEANDANSVWIAELTTNILARLYPRVAIQAPQDVADDLKRLAHRINPQVELADSAPAQLTVHVGIGESPGAIYASANGWVASMSYGPPVNSGKANPYAAGAAAALACGEIFRRVFLQSGSQRDLSVSLLDYTHDGGRDTDLPCSSLGEVAFVGVGAIGGAGLWALARDAQREGHLWLVDHDEVTLHNLQRYVLAMYEDVCRPKVAVAKRAMEASRVHTSKFKLTLAQFASKNHGPKVPTICISVDNVEGRRSAQALLPRLIVNGWTGDGALGVSWHIFDRDVACLACLYHPRKPGPSATEQAARALGLAADRAAFLWVTRAPLNDDDLQTAATTLGVSSNQLRAWRGKTLGELYTDVICGAVPLTVKALGTIEVVPLAHQSALAGVLMAAELVKRTSVELTDRSQQEVLVSYDDILAVPPTDWKKPRAREKGCICGDPDYQQVYREKWRNRSA
jgi:hypothetical protein